MLDEGGREIVKQKGRGEREHQGKEKDAESQAVAKKRQEGGREWRGMGGPGGGEGKEWECS